MAIWIINIVLILCSISMIVLVILQKNSASGMGSAFGGGGDENYFGKNQSRSKQARLSLFTKINAGVIAILSSVLVIILR